MYCIVKPAALQRQVVCCVSFVQIGVKLPSHIFLLLDVFSKLESKKVEKAFVTLHVGRGTFAPVKTEDLEDHKMHTEHYFYSPENRDKILKAQKEGRKVHIVCDCCDTREFGSNDLHSLKDVNSSIVIGIKSDIVL